MFELQVKLEFSAAHHIEGYPGDCARVHGHNWTIEVFAQSEALDPLGMAIDFRTLKAAVHDVIGAWDHQDLNALPDFAQVQPTAEQIAKMICDKVTPTLTTQSKSRVSKVTVWENSHYAASYLPKLANL